MGEKIYPDLLVYVFRKYIWNYIEGVDIETVAKGTELSIEKVKELNSNLE